MLLKNFPKLIHKEIENLDNFLKVSLYLQTFLKENSKPKEFLHEF